MDATRQFDIQRQIRNNNEDFHQYAREFKLWETEMKRKDKELCEHSSKKDVPPIRKKVKREVQNTNAVKSKRISAFDYSSWDKFDVDKACEEMDHADSDEDEDTDVEEEDLDRIASAVYNKEQGNKLVKEGKWGEAIEKYNVAIQIYPHDAVFFANRALCFLKMKNFVSAEADCTSSLKLDNTYVKAYLRRASARRSLSQFGEARNDILKVLHLEPNNKQAEVELAELSRKLSIPLVNISDSKSLTDVRSVKEEFHQDTRTKSKTSNSARENITKSSKSPDLSWVPAYDTSLYSAVPRHYIPPHQRSKSIMKKLNIEPRGTDTHTSKAFISTSIIEDKTRKIQIIDEVERGDLVNIKQEIEEKKVDLKNDSENRRKKLEILESAWNELQNANPYKKIVEDSVNVNREPTMNVKVKNESLQDPHVKTVVIPDAPKTCSQFELHWRTLKSSEENLYLYLKQIKGSELPAIFKEGLETFTFLDILECLCGKFVENGDIIGDYLQGLASTPRLASIVMLMTPSEKALLSKLIKYCEEKNQLNAFKLNQLIQTFEL